MRDHVDHVDLTDLADLADLADHVDMSWSGQTYLTSAEVEHLVEVSKGSFTQEQILLLYKRFRTLDKAKRGYLQSSDLVNSIPELSINPLNKRIVRDRRRDSRRWSPAPVAPVSHAWLYEWMNGSPIDAPTPVRLCRHISATE